MRFSKEEVFENALKYFNGDDLAAGVAIGKYLLKDEEGYIESSPDDIHKRMAKEFARMECQYSPHLNFEAVEEEFYQVFKDFKYIVPQGSIMYGLGNPKASSLSNCTVIASPKDSLSGIFETGKQMANLYRMRAGVGNDVSTLRPDGAFVDNAANSSTGAHSFLDFYSYITKLIGQSGRRGALLLSMDIKHPDVKKFITSKLDPTKVTGANISVRASDEFFKAVEADEDFELKWPIDSDEPKYTETVKARELFDLIVKTATDTADPGLFFFDRMVKYTPTENYERFRTITTNPCIVGSTKVHVADGRGYVTIEELAEAGNDVPVYALSPEGNLEIKTMRNPRLTGINEEIYEITLDSGAKLRTTKNHQFLKVDGQYSRVDELKPGDSLHIAWRKHLSIKDVFKNGNARSKDYIWHQVEPKKRNKTEHRMIWENANGKIPEKCIIHHKDYDSQNNSLDNLVCMTKREHDRFHAKDMIGNKNPIHAVLADPERAARYKANMSEAVSGEKNGRYIDVKPQALKEHAEKLCKLKKRVFTENEWHEYASSMDLPKVFMGFRLNQLGVKTFGEFAKNAASKAGVVNNIRLYKIIKKAEENGYSYQVIDNKVFVEKTCETCEKKFLKPWSSREISYCSKECINHSYPKGDGWIKFQENKSNLKKKEQARIYNDLKFKLNREPKAKEWEQECKLQNIPHRLYTKYSFKTYDELKEYAAELNHKIVSVEFVGYDKVYNGTVDDYHNFYVGGFEEIDKETGKKKFCNLNNLNCGEIPLGIADACRLISHNLLSYVDNPFTEKASFNFDLFDKHCRIKTRLGDNLVDLELERIEKILEKARREQDESEIRSWTDFYETGRDGRRLGLGTHGLADALAALNLRYDSDEAMEMVSRIYEAQKISCYDESVELAIERGPFPAFDWQLEKDNEFILSLPKWLQDKITKHGRRNIAILTNAPTGSVAILSQTSSGIEPVFRFDYDRRRKLMPDDTAKPDFIDATGERFLRYKVYHHNVERWANVTQGDKTKLPVFFVSSDEIDWRKRIELQSLIQKNLCNSVSSTINLPKGTPYETVAEIYMEAWRQGLKGVTVYVDGSRDGILLSKDSESKSFEQRDAIKRPEELECDVHYLTVKGQKYTIFVGLADGKPYEVMGGKSEFIELPSTVSKGKIIKKSFKTVASKYEFKSDDIKIKDIGKVFDNPNHEVVTRLISLGLRHGAKPSYLVEQLQRDPDSDFFSFSKSLARTLKKYIADGEKASDKVCPECKAEGSLEYREGCVTCSSCGWSKCG